MEKLTLTFVGRYTTKKDGTPLVGKTGKPYTSLRIKCNEYGDKYLSGFDGAATQGWKEGDVVEVEVEQKGEYLNFSVPRKEDIAFSEVSKLAGKHTTLELRFNRLLSELVGKGILEMPEPSKPVVAGTTVEYPDSGFAPEDIPFD